MKGKNEAKWPLRSANKDPSTRTSLGLMISGHWTLNSYLAQSGQNIYIKYNCKKTVILNSGAIIDGNYIKHCGGSQQKESNFSAAISITSNCLCQSILIIGQICTKPTPFRLNVSIFDKYSAHNTTPAKQLKI